MQITDEAVERITSIIGDPNNSIPETASLRVFVTGGGCGGFQYGFEISNTIEEDDVVIEKGGARFLVDPISYGYIGNATLKYVVDLMGDSFVIDNPDVATTCGCGSSFSM